MVWVPEWPVLISSIRWEKYRWVNSVLLREQPQFRVYEGFSFTLWRDMRGCRFWASLRDWGKGRRVSESAQSDTEAPAGAPRPRPAGKHTEMSDFVPPRQVPSLPGTCEILNVNSPSPGCGPADAASHLIPGVETVIKRIKVILSSTNSTKQLS